MAETSAGVKTITGYLKKIIGSPVGEIIPLYNKDIRIGRTVECDIRIKDPNISRNHCSLHYSSDKWFITDFGGINGTYLDSEKLMPRIPSILKDGLGIYLGPPSDSPVAFVFIQNKQAKETLLVPENIQSKKESPASEDDTQSTQLNLKKRTSSSTDASPSKKHAPSISSHQPTIPHHLDDGTDSDVSICSLDSLRTRIRKMNSQNKNKGSSNSRNKFASSSASPALRPTLVEPVPSTSSSGLKLKSGASEKLKDLTTPGVIRELESVFDDDTDSLGKAQLSQANLTEKACPSSDIPKSDKNEVNGICEKKNKNKLKTSPTQEESSEKLGAMLEEELICNICTEVFIKATTLGCSHTFCEHCILLWKKKQNRCPICRETIISQTRVLIMDNFIEKAVEKLDKTYQDKRKVVIENREAEKANEKNKKPRRRKGPRSRYRRSRQSGGQSRASPGTSSILTAFDASVYQGSLSFLNALDDIETSANCTICGQSGHPTILCPNLSD